MATVPKGKVRIIAGRAYGPGAELPGGKSEGAAKASAGLPDGFPHAELLTGAGFSTEEKLRTASDEDLLAVDGIGETRLKEIRKALK